MKVKVVLWSAGTVFHEIVIAPDYETARKTAIARNPSARVLSATAVF